jgi:hypothetical protein
MPSGYTTEDLVQILAAEQRACVNGQRLNLTVTQARINPLIDRFLNTEGLQKFTAYAEFRATIHRYQIEHQVSGIVWRHLTLRGQSLAYPIVHDQLIALPEDLTILKQAKPQVLEFWHHITVGMALYLAVNAGREHRPLIASDIAGISDRTEWATITSHGEGDRLVVMLQLGWGNPRDALDWRSFPASGSEQICAVAPNRPPISY